MSDHFTRCVGRTVLAELWRRAGACCDNYVEVGIQHMSQGKTATQEQHHVLPPPRQVSQSRLYPYMYRHRDNDNHNNVCFSVFPMPFSFMVRCFILPCSLPVPCFFVGLFHSLAVLECLFPSSVSSFRAFQGFKISLAAWFA